MNAKINIQTYEWKESECFELLWFKDCLTNAKLKEQKLLFFHQKNNPVPPTFSIHDHQHSIESNNILFLALAAKSNAPTFKLNQDISFTYLLSDIKSFYVTYPLFDLLLKKIAENKYATLEKLINQVVLRKFIVEDNSNRESLTEQEMIFVVPFRNCVQYLQACYRSLVQQRYINFKIVLIDDYSTDGTQELLNNINNPHTSVIKNKSQKFALKSLIDCLDNLNATPESIICIVDGDDMLTQEYVLACINYYYSTLGCLLTYGSYMNINSGMIYTSAYEKGDFKDIRQAEWQASHLKTFKYKLYLSLKEKPDYTENFKDKQGRWLKAPYDMAIMFPLLEIAKFEKTKHIEFPIYGYRTHANNDHIIMRHTQLDGETILRSKKEIH